MLLGDQGRRAWEWTPGLCEMRVHGCISNNGDSGVIRTKSRLGQDREIERRSIEGSSRENFSVMVGENKDTGKEVEGFLG